MTSSASPTPSAAPLVLLDLDGTLTDSAPGILRCAVHALASVGIPSPGAAALRRFVGPPIHDSFALHGVTEARMAEAEAAYRTEYTAAGMYENEVYDGIRDALAELRTAGFTLAVATSKPHHLALQICDHFGLTESVDGIWGAPPHGTRSTKATVIAEALTDLARDSHYPGASRTVMVGDRSHDVLGAAAHSIDCVGVRWGYAEPGELETAGAVEVVERPSQLAARVVARLTER